MQNSISKLLLVSALTLSSLVSSLGQAAELQPFALTYKASYGKFDAAATRTLTRTGDTNNWEMKSKIEVKLLGTVASSVEETSAFSWQNDLAVPSRYDYVQKGLGHRERKLEFAAGGKSANYTDKDKTGVLTFTTPVFDNLTSGLMLRKQLLSGATDINFTVADKSEATVQNYQVVGKESTVTPAGTFSTVHVKRMRDGDSKRTTDLWLAPDHDYVLVKFLQNEPDGDTISLELKSGTIGGKGL